MSSLTLHNQRKRQLSGWNVSKALLVLSEPNRCSQCPCWFTCNLVGASLDLTQPSKAAAVDRISVKVSLTYMSCTQCSSMVPWVFSLRLYS